MNGIDTMRTRLDDHLECSRCQAPPWRRRTISAALRMRSLGRTLGARAIRMPAEGVCLICEKRIAGSVRTSSRGPSCALATPPTTSSTPWHKSLIPSTTATALDVKSRLEQQGLHPHFLRSKGSGWDGLAVNSLRVMVRPGKSKKRKKPFACSGSRSFERSPTRKPGGIR